MSSADIYDPESLCTKHFLSSFSSKRWRDCVRALTLRLVTVTSPFTFQSASSYIVDGTSCDDDCSIARARHNVHTTGYPPALVRFAPLSESSRQRTASPRSLLPFCSSFSLVRSPDRLQQQRQCACVLGFHSRQHGRHLPSLSSILLLLKATDYIYYSRILLDGIVRSASVRECDKSHRRTAETNDTVATTIS